MAIKFDKSIFPEHRIVRRITTRWKPRFMQPIIAFVSIDKGLIKTKELCTIAEMEQILSKMKELQGENKS